ncbi:PepSY domain-containing protein [Salinicola aestuarinus]|uniref:PepSY domain-containing protein n=1 Tax=Salinicola aestuarinus TaxID=1949082 RepID=UPI000DA23560|nr:PepSY domain-containing protein [Salinicola aestuarinus]
MKCSLRLSSLVAGVCLAVAAACGPPTVARADGTHWRDLHQQVEAGHLVGLNEIMDWLEARYQGQILEVELEQNDDNGSLKYEVEMIGPQGQVVAFEFDARSGKLLSVEGVNIEAMRKPSVGDTPRRP